MENNPSPEKLLNRPGRPGSAGLNDNIYAVNKKYPNAFPTFRPITGKGVVDMHSGSRQPKSPSVNRERLYEENISLKLKANSLQEENMKLRTKINQIEKDLNKKEDSEFTLVRTSSKSHLIPNLKQSIKDLKDQIKNKEDEIGLLKKSIKSTKLSEIEIEMQSYADECTRLRHHLEEIMIQKHISFASLDFEEKLFRQNMDINTLRQENIEYSQALSKAREDIVVVKDKISSIENPLKKRKKTSRKKQELQKLKSEILDIKEKIESDKIKYAENEKKLLEEAENLNKINDTISDKIQATEFKLQEQNIILEQLRTQMMNHEKDFKRSQTIDAPSLSTYRTKKLQNPPKLFQKIFSVVNKKQMITDVFFSLMDKNSNAMIDSDEIYQYMLANGCKVKKKYIQEALNLMASTNNSIPLTLFQEHYDKYEYKIVDEESSSEEVVEVPKKVVQKLSHHVVDNIMPEGPLIPEVTVGTRVIREEKKIKTVKLEEIKEVLDEIVMKMRAMKLPKSKLLSKVFGNDFNADEQIGIDALADMLSLCSMNFGNKEKNYLLARFLIEPEGVSEILEKSQKDLKSDILLISKRFTKLFTDWEVYTDQEAKQTMHSIFENLSKIKPHLSQNCSKHDLDHKGWIDFSTFQTIINNAGVKFSDREFDIWKLEIYPIKDINYISLLNSLKYSRPLESILKIICTKLNTLSTSPENLFNISSQGLITADDFIQGINKLNLDLTNDEILELLESVKYKDNKFSASVHINDLYKLLIQYGFIIQMITSSEDDETYRKSIEGMMIMNKSSSSSDSVSSGSDDN
ncbi:hypothetical protein SteCoe_1890 [Stentor coeruleus]|uniref:EF-hand domain-containing protein n=1 Tax=Stentor coeruleus TaxID=5963 RepID=A0A1R2D0W1_9CILI|nr:hypothetical protein SteCoe_1890 [Stentor coeruleus]